MTTVQEPRFIALVDRLFSEAEASQDRLRQWMSERTPQEVAAWRSSADGYRTLYHHAKDEYLAVSRSTARLLYIVARSRRARAVVEFGSSFGISTLHLAAAIRDNGGGVLIGSDFESGKVAQARRNLADAGLAELVDIREGDALQTLADDLPSAVDLVFLDGAKQLYLPILSLVEPHLASGAVIVADNSHDAPDYLDHVRRSPGYVSTDLGGDVELSLRGGAQ
jgi:predicted O-methyltransferase YrrM